MGLPFVLVLVGLTTGTQLGVHGYFSSFFSSMCRLILDGFGGLATSQVFEFTLLGRHF